MFCQVRDFGKSSNISHYAPVEIHCATKQNCLRNGLNILYRASQRSADHIINDDLKISTAHHIKEVLFLDVRCKIENTPYFWVPFKKYSLPMSSPVGVQWLYWTGIEGCKRGATIIYHNHDLYIHIQNPRRFHCSTCEITSFCLFLSGTWSLGMCNKQASQMKWNFTTLQKCNAICQWKLLLECLLTLPCEKLTPCTYGKGNSFPNIGRDYVSSDGIEEPCLFSNYPSVYMRAKTIFVFQLLQNSG